MNCKILREVSKVLSYNSDVPERRKRDNAESNDSFDLLSENVRFLQMKNGSSPT